MSCNISHIKITIRGAGEMATGTAWRLYQAGFRNLLLTEIARPLTVRRLVSFSEAVHEGKWTVEGVTATLVESADLIEECWRSGNIAVMVDPDKSALGTIEPDVVVDAILAKKNLGTTVNDASLVIGLGPGFTAGSDVHWVVETDRGHNLGRLILEGSASADTGVPGSIGGHTTARVLRAPDNGDFRTDYGIGHAVHVGDVVGYVNEKAVTAEIDGIVRGLIRRGTPVYHGLKIGDVDPRNELSYCSTISEKARAIGGTVLEAVMRRYNVP